MEVDLSKHRLQITTAAERLRESLWFVPGVMVLVTVVLAAALASSEARAPSISLIRILLPSDADGARAVLQVVAGSVITVTSVVFSLTVVALQITAGNYSPRVLRTFLRDFGTQVVLGTFLGTFTLTYLILQNIRPLPGKGAAWAPELAFVAIPIFVAGSLVALVFFIHHVTQSIRVDLIVGEVLDDLLSTIRNTHGHHTRRLDKPHVRDIVPPDAVPVTANSSGFVQMFGASELVEVLERIDAEAALRPTVGDHLLEGTTMGWVWRRSGGERQVPNEVVTAVQEAVQIGRERSIQQDVAFGLRQLVDVAVRALSPGVNDPNTAVTVIEHLAIAYRELLECGPGPVAYPDEAGTRRVTAPYPTFEEYLHIATQQIAHYGRGDLMIVLRLLRTLGELKDLASLEHQEVFDRQIRWVLSEAELGLQVEAHVETARLAARDALNGSSEFRHYTAAG